MTSMVCLAPIERGRDSKLFPRNCNEIVRKIQQRIKEKTGRQIEVMVYGDGAFKDPVGQIWEACGSRGFARALRTKHNGATHEMKLKYIADNVFLI